jgi:hypothetical protein
MTSWDEIRGKIKYAYDEIASAYEIHVVSAADKVKERPLLNTAVKMSLSAIPGIGPNLRDLYDNIGSGTKPEEDKAKQILEFLEKLEQQNQEQFDKIAEDLNTNRQVIIDAINENRLSITDLISKSSAVLLKEVHSVKDDTIEIRARIEQIQDMQSTLIEKVNKMLTLWRPRFEQNSVIALEELISFETEFISSVHLWFSNMPRSDMFFGLLSIHEIVMTRLSDQIAELKKIHNMQPTTENDKTVLEMQKQIGATLAAIDQKMPP